MPWDDSLSLQQRLPRGVYEAPYYDDTGAVVLVAITATHRLLARRPVRRAIEYATVRQQLQDELDAHDPVRLRLEG